jgi:hypothetical protein
MSKNFAESLGWEVGVDFFSDVFHNCYLYVHYTESIDVPFYIGIGMGNRYKSRHGRNMIWNNKVSKHNGFKYAIVIDKCSREEAFIFERMFISKYGRIDNKSGILANRTIGGEGTGGHLSPYSIQVFSDGKIFKSISSAARYFNITVSTVRQRCDSKYFNWTIVGEENNYSGEKGKPYKQCVLIDDIKYESVKDASIKLNIPDSTIHNRLNNKNNKSYVRI